MGALKSIQSGWRNTSCTSVCPSSSLVPFCLFTHDHFARVWSEASQRFTFKWDSPLVSCAGIMHSFIILPNCVSWSHLPLSLFRGGNPPLNGDIKVFGVARVLIGLGLTVSWSNSFYPPSRSRKPGRGNKSDRCEHKVGKVNFFWVCSKLWTILSQ